MIEIKKIAPTDDIEAIVHTIQNSKWSPESEIHRDDYTVKDLKEFLVRPESVFIVAYLDQQFAGMASAKILNKPTGDTWLYIDEVDVCQNMQKKGVGTELMKYFLTFAKDSECIEVWLGTEVDNTAANKLYSSLNPNEIQQFIGYTFDLNHLE